MSLVWRLFTVLMAGLPLVAAWIWWADGAWENGALSTQGLIWVVGGCACSLAILAVKRKITP